ncbi:YoaK family protein [Mesorhizobium escarrei]|uniref:Permease n=1 Tax=Mesorhizobium escarrei TaxID=666018 RepID=A0ABN8JH78_9HYPH|nr:YoaK family protein [Mesorhizobium escarrei]CAH2397185.1 Permease [Mesorhizobium escarrei]
MTNQEPRSCGPTVDVVARSVFRAEPTEVPIAAISVVPAAVPALLAFVAGYVDSCTFLAFTGLFVAQMTGSFVVAGSELVARNDGFLIKVLAIPIFFAAGVLTTIIVRALGSDSRRALVATLALEAALLAGLACADVSSGVTTVTSVAVLFDLSAMGVQSATVRLLLVQYGSTNVMTTNTTQLAIDLTDMLLASRRNPRDAVWRLSYKRARLALPRVAPIMLGFVAGTVAGGLAYTSIGLDGLVFAVGIVATLAIWAVKGSWLRR